jgi:stage II sporulation protein D
MVPPVIRTAVIFFLLILVACFTCLHACFARDGDTIRVAILQEAVMARVSINGFYTIEDAASRAVLFTGKDLSGAVTAYSNRVSINNRQYAQNKLLLTIEDPDALQVNGRRYHGSLAIVRSKGAMTLVNYLDLEEYIKGIAVREVSHYWPADALAAQAIVFRTYALYAMKQNASRDFDVTSDVYSQVYGGTGAQRYRITDAINDTAGDVLTYQGAVMPAFYHSTCGGNTERAAALWNLDLAPLQGVECPFCRSSPHYSWKSTIPVAKAAGLFNKAGVKISQLTGIERLGTDRSGRVTELTLHMSDGTQIKVAAKDFRNILGPDTIKSTNFTVSMHGTAIDIEGIGWGHGVGLCQWGAYFMAKAGYSFREILSFYYPGTQIANIHTQKVLR